MGNLTPCGSGATVLRRSADSRPHHAPHALGQARQARQARQPVARRVASRTAGQRQRRSRASTERRLHRSQHRSECTGGLAKLPKTCSFETLLQCAHITMKKFRTMGQVRATRGQVRVWLLCGNSWLAYPQKTVKKRAASQTPQTRPLDATQVSRAART